jgi:hypothetical protein
MDGEPVREMNPLFETGAIDTFVESLSQKRTYYLLLITYHLLLITYYLSMPLLQSIEPML